LAQEIAEVFTRSLPRIAANVGETGLRAGILAGIDRAERWNFIAKRDVARYVMLTFFLGIDFADDSLHPWANAILTSDQISSSTKVDVLCQRGLAFMNASRGSNNEHLNASYRYFTQLPFAELVPEPDGEPLQYVAARVWSTFPRCCAIATETPISNVATEAIRMASAEGIDEYRGATLTAGLMLCVGKEFRHDPWHAWTEAVWHEGRTAPADQRAQRLHAAIVRHMCNEGKRHG
jgi:hypothetical protein